MSKIRLLPATETSINAMRSRTDRYTSTPRFGGAHLTTGVRLRYAESGDTSAHSVILLHGYSDSWFSFSRVLPSLAAGHHVYALDQRGHGDSERPAGGYSLRDLAADVIAFMDAEGLARATLIGHCMGSFVAERVALAAPERVAHLVLISSTTTPHNIEGILELQRAVEALEDPVPDGFVREFQASTVYGPLPERFMHRVVAESLKLPARVWRELMAGMLATERPARLGDSRIPTLILWGDRDSLFTRAAQDSLAAALPAATLKVYRETGHSPHSERPEQVVRDLEYFISRTAPS